MEDLGYEHDIEQVNDQLPLLGTDIDACTEEQLDIEIFPDRPDLLSGETLPMPWPTFSTMHRPVPTSTSNPAALP